MLRLTIPLSPEGWDEEKQEFVEPKTITLNLEHSLISLSKWESKWCKPFLSKEPKTIDETIDYIRCMTLSKKMDETVYGRLTNDNIKTINSYIESPMTATTFNNLSNKSPSREIITSEIIYYWMIMLGIPFECQKWHLNRLLTLIRVCNVKNTPPKKMSKKEIFNRNAALNAARRKKLNTKG